MYLANINTLFHMFNLKIFKKEKKYEYCTYSETNDADYHRKVWKLSVKIHLIAGISRMCCIPLSTVSDVRHTISIRNEYSSMYMFK